MALIDNLAWSYELDEASGDAIDAHGAAADLTDTNTVGGNGGAGRDFEAGNSERFLHADGAAWSFGNEDFTLSIEFTAESLDASQVLIGKADFNTANEYALYYNSGTSQFRFFVSDDGSTLAIVTATVPSPPSTATKYILFAWHDATANTINISVNDGTVYSASHTLGVLDGSAQFNLGAGTGPILHADGILRRARAWRRVLTSGEITELYNSGSGRAYSYMSAASSYTFTGPTSGNVNAASTNFTLTPNGTFTGTITPATDGSGSFSPSSLTWTAESGGKTCTYTPTSTAGSPHTLSVTDDGGLTDPASIDYAVNGTDTIACTDLTQDRIYQRAAGGTTKTISFAGTYSGTAPTTVEVKIINESGGSTAQDWTAISSATISGGNWSGTLSVPQGGWYHFQARGKDGGGSVLATSTETSNEWGVGILVALLGQSNMSNMIDTVSSPASTDTRTKKHTASGWAAVTGNGAIALANALRTELTFPVGILAYAVSSTALHEPISGSDYWLDLTAGEPYPLFTTGLTAVGGDCEVAIWLQGEGEATIGRDKAVYKADMDTLLGRILSATGRTTSNFHFGCALLGAVSTNNAAYHDAIRQAHLEWGRETTGAFYAGSPVDMPLVDVAHWSAASYARMGKRYAQAIARRLGEASFGYGPTISSAVCYSDMVIITVTHDGATGLTELDGTDGGAGVTGLEVSDDDFATTITIEATSFLQPNRILLNLNETPSASFKLRYQYGNEPDADNAIYDNTAPGGDTVGLPLQPTQGNVTVSLAASGGGGGLFRTGLIQ